MNKPVHEKRMLCLGDSYTIGEFVQAEERWASQLCDSLSDKKINLKSPKIIARTGWTTAELLQAIEKEKIKKTFSLVTVCVGVNDQYRNHDTSVYIAAFNELMSKAISFAGGDPAKVVVISIPDWGVTPFAHGRNRNRIAGDIDLFNEINSKIARSLGCNYVNITPISRQAISDPTLIAADGLHPSAKMYALWVKEMLPVIENMVHKNNDKED